MAAPMYLLSASRSVISHPCMPMAGLDHHVSALKSSSCHAFSTTNPVAMAMHSFSFSSASSSFVNKLPAELASATSNGSRVYCNMQVVNPCTNRRFETLSYVPALSDEQIAKQVDYIILKGWVPCLEFDHESTLSRENSRGCGYYDGRYWTLWKLPMFGCMDAGAVLREIDECKKTYPNAYIRLMAFDNKRQTQVVAVVVHKPSSS